MTLRADAVVGADGRSSAVRALTGIPGDPYATIARACADDVPEPVILKVLVGREPEISTIQRLQVEAMRLPPPARSALSRATLLPLLRTFGVMKRMMLRSEMPFRHGITDVRLTV